MKNKISLINEGNIELGIVVDSDDLEIFIQGNDKSTFKMKKEEFYNFVNQIEKVL